MAMITPPTKSKTKTTSTNTVKTDIAQTITKAKPTASTEQTPPDAIKPLQLKIPEGRKNEFKAYAAMRGRSMNALFLDMFNEYKEKHV